MPDTDTKTFVYIKWYHELGKMPIFILRLTCQKL